MTGEAEARLHDVGERDAGVLLPELLRNVSFASDGDDSFRPFSAPASDVSFRSSVITSSDMGFDDDDAMYSRMQSEYQEIPSFRWIASALRWWGTRRTSHSFASARDASFQSSVISSADMEELGDGRVMTSRMQSEYEDILPFPSIATPRRWWRIRYRSNATKGTTGGKMVHFGPLPALVRTSVEALGKDTYGSLWKAKLKDGSQVAVRRLQGEIVGEFEAKLDLLEKIRHPNLLALRAYYFSKDDLLLVFDYMPKGSLSTFLHAGDPDKPKAWGTRMKIAIGITWGLHYLHTEKKMVHGKLSSGNILLDENANARIANYGLYHLTDNAGNLIGTASRSEEQWYRAPELSKLKAANTKTDVYSLGVILLELLTGKSPGEAPGDLDLPQWVTSTMNEGRSLQVFDEELRERRAEDLFYALNVALHCVNPSLDARPELAQVLHQLSEINAYPYCH